jgi:putative endonuclease
MNAGKIGEDVATSYLKKLGYIILDRNFRIRNGEIDIIAFDKKDNALVFVEVKTRSSHAYGTPLEAIHYWKVKALRNAAMVYKNNHRNLPDLLRIDAVSVMLKDGEVANVEHMKNISY